MLIGAPESAVADGRRRVEAVLRWEVAERPPRGLWFDAPAGADGFRPTLDAFVMAAFPVALAAGERRLRVEGRVCARLRSELGAAMARYERWFGLRPLSLEAGDGFAPSARRPTPRTAAFLSGGVDSLALLWANTRQYPDAHPGRIRDCLFLFGTNTHDFDEEGRARPERLRMFEEQRERLERLAGEAGCELLTMGTNARALHPDFTAWRNLGFAPACVGGALTFAARFDRVWLASDGDRLEGLPESKHPLVLTHLATAALQTNLGQVAVDRLDKLRLLLGWDEALACLRVCLLRDELPPGKVNCGRCEKCLRTMVALLVLGRLDDAGAFDPADLTPERLAGVRIQPWTHAFYESYGSELRRLGHGALASALERRLRAWERGRRG